MANFTDILDRKSSEIERPKPLPVGTYLWLIDGQPKFDKSQKQQTPYVEFTCRCLQPMDDVDPQALADMGGHAGKTQRLTFYLTEDAMFRLTNKDGNGFLEHLGLTGDESVREKISMAPGRQFLGTVRHRSSQDGAQVFAEISSTAAV